MREQLDAHGEVLPRWRVHPQIERYSIGWRMGNGEWHLMVGGHWWESAHMDEAERIAYFQAGESPYERLNWAEHQIWPDMDYGKARVRRPEHGIGAAR